MSKTLDNEVRAFERIGDSRLLSAVVLNKSGELVVDAGKVKEFIEAAQEVCDHLNSPEQKAIGRSIAREEKMKRIIPLCIFTLCATVLGFAIGCMKKTMERDKDGAAE